MLHNATVIMNTYREHPTYLKEAIDSYLNQLGINLQLIICTIENDTSIEYIKKNYHNNKIEFCIIPIKEHPGKGPAGIFYQLNKACELIKYEWYAYASSNDVALPLKLKTEIELCIKHNKLVCYSNFYSTCKILKNRHLNKFHPYNFLKHIKGNFVNDCALIKTNTLKAFLPFRYETFMNHSYWDLWLRIYEKLGNVFVFNPKPTFLYRILNTSQHIERKQDKNKLLTNELYRTKLKNHHMKIYKIMQ